MINKNINTKNMYFFIFLFFCNINNCFILLPLKIILSQKQSIINKIRSIENEYAHFISFIHEFHHIVGSKILSNNYKDINNTYIITQKKIFPEIPFINPAAYNIKFNKENYFEYKYEEKTELTILKLRMLLSGYAAEEAFKKKSILLAYFVETSSFVDTKCIFSLLLSNIYFKKIISDVNQLFNHEVDIDFNNKKINDYIQKYNKKPNNKENIIILKKLYPETSENFLKLLYIIYEELINEYSEYSHQRKFYSMITKNPSLLANEIFFFKDLKSLWENQQLYRIIGDTTKYDHKEKIILDALINKKIHTFDEIEKLKKKEMTIFKINTISEKIYYYKDLIHKKIKNLSKKLY
jgi:hypothetical protein